jgi:uncharacterized iron-regulated protein
MIMDKILEAAKTAMLGLIGVAETRTFDQFVGTRAHNYNSVTVQSALDALVSDGKLEQIKPGEYKRLK